MRQNQPSACGAAGARHALCGQDRIGDRAPPLNRMPGSTGSSSGPWARDGVSVDLYRLRFQDGKIVADTPTISPRQKPDPVPRGNAWLSAADQCAFHRLAAVGVSQLFRTDPAEIACKGPEIARPTAQPALFLVAHRTCHRDRIDAGQLAPQRPRDGHIFHQGLGWVSANPVIKRSRQQKPLIAVRQTTMAAQVGPARNDPSGQTAIIKGQVEPARLVMLKMLDDRTDPTVAQLCIRMQHQKPAPLSDRTAARKLRPARRRAVDNLRSPGLGKFDRVIPRAAVADDHLTNETHLKPGHERHQTGPQMLLRIQGRNYHRNRCAHCATPSNWRPRGYIPPKQR